MGCLLSVRKDYAEFVLVVSNANVSQCERDHLFYAFLEIMRELVPRYVLLEVMVIGANESSLCNGSIKYFGHAVHE